MYLKVRERFYDDIKLGHLSIAKQSLKRRKNPGAKFRNRHQMCFFHNFSGGDNA